MHLYVAPATPLGRGTPRYHAGISRGYARMRLHASRAAAEQVGSVARFGWHAPPGVKCHTCIVTVCARKGASVASIAAARVVSQSCDSRELCPGAVHRPAKNCQLLQTIANYCTCMWLQRRHWGAGRRAIMREYLVGMPGCVCSRRAPAEQAGSVARFGWHAPPGVKCHTCILTVCARKVASVARTAAARVVSQSCDCREQCPGTVHRPAKNCKLLQTIANYCTCMWLQRRCWGA